MTWFVQTHHQVAGGSLISSLCFLSNPSLTLQNQIKTEDTSVCEHDNFLFLMFSTLIRTQIIVIQTLISSVSSWW